MKTDHAPGPWTIRKDGRYNHAFGIEKTSNGLRSIIALMNDDWLCEEHGKLKANAKLIAAAPLMLKELRRCQQIIFEYIYGDETPEMCAFAEAEADALEAIRQATE